jgi:hypothetical protein
MSTWTTRRQLTTVLVLNLAKRQVRRAAPRPAQLVDAAG